MFRQKKGKSKSIQSVIVNEPNELLQIDYIYLFRNIAPQIVIEENKSAEDKKKKFYCAVTFGE